MTVTRTNYLSRWLAMLGAAAVLAAASQARADLIVSVQSVTANAGSTGNMLEVDLRNTGPGATVPIGAFSFGLSTTNPGITFTQATTATTLAPYIFDGQSLFGPNITNTSGTSLTAADAFATIGSGTSLGQGVTEGLGKVFFNVAAGTTPGPVTVTVTPYPTTSLSDTTIPIPNNIPITTLNSGTITIPGTTPPGPTIPEPSTALLAVLAWPAVAWWARRYRRRPPALHGPAVRQ
jgi:hypothetical protein